MLGGGGGGGGSGAERVFRSFIRLVIRSSLLLWGGHAYRMGIFVRWVRISPALRDCCNDNLGFIGPPLSCG